MSSQPNKPLSIAVLRVRNGEISGFEDLFLLTYQNTLSDIRASVSDEKTTHDILRNVYMEVWRKRDSIPEAGIVRPWIRLMIRDAVKKATGQTIDEFSSEPATSEVKDLSGSAEEDLLFVEDALQLVSLPDSITGRKRPISMPVSVLRFLLSLGAIGVAVFASAFLVRQAGRIDETPASTARAEIEVNAEAETGETAETLNENAVGWIDTKNGRRYRQEDGSWLESAWLEDGEFLYYLDENGYALTGNRQFGVQNFTFDETGALTGISRAYGKETSRTVLTVQMENFGHGDDARNIIDDSITLDENWIYYLYEDSASNTLPILLRVMQDSDETQLIAEDVTGYTVQENNVWYCSDGEIRYFAKGTEGTAVSGTYTVTEEDGAWYLKDEYGRNVTGSGGYETIGRRVYRLEDGRIKYVRPDAQKIDNYTFQCENAGVSPVIRLGDGREYIRQGLAVDSLATLGESLYYSVLISGGSAPVSQIWRMDIYTGVSEAVSEAFPGRILTMYPYADRNEIYMEYRPGTSLYGRVAVISGGAAYVLNDESARKGGFSGGNDLLEPVWVEDDDVRCYWDECGGVSSDGTIQVLETRLLTLSASDRTKLGGASGSAADPVFFGGTSETVSEGETTGEVSEDEMVESAADSATDSAETEVSGTDSGSTEENSSADSTDEAETDSKNTDDTTVESTTEGPGNYVNDNQAETEETPGPGAAIKEEETVSATTVAETVEAAPTAASRAESGSTSETVAPIPMP